MEQAVGFRSTNQLLGSTRCEQVGLVPLGARARLTRAARLRLNLMPAGEQRVERVATDETGGPSQQDPAHGEKSG